jgi:hypothetical protein
MFPQWFLLLNFIVKKGIWVPVRSLLLESLKRENDMMFSSEFRNIENARLDGSLGKRTSIDRVLRNIPLCYKMKRTTDERKMRLFDRFNERPLTYSDFFVR